MMLRFGRQGKALRRQLSPIALPHSAGKRHSSSTSVVTDGVLAAPSTFFENPSYVVMQSIDFLHTWMNVPYWEAIVIITLGVRLAMLPMSIAQIRTTSTLAILKPEIDKIQAAALADPDKSSERGQRYSQEVQEVFKRNNFRPMMMWMPFMQLPVFVGFFMGIREMGNYFPGFRTGGILWFEDLAGTDPTYVLPVLNGLSMLLMFETGMASNPGQQNREQAEIMRWVMRAASVAMVPLMISMPNGLFVHWGVNNVYTMAQTAILARDDVKKYLRIPKLPASAQSSPPTPSPSSPFLKLYEENARLIKEKGNKFRK